MSYAFYSQVNIRESEVPNIYIIRINRKHVLYVLIWLKLRRITPHIRIILSNFLKYTSKKLDSYMKN